MCRLFDVSKSIELLMNVNNLIKHEIWSRTWSPGTRKARDYSTK